MNNHNDSGDEKSYIWVIGRGSGDEKEYSPIGHGWLKLTGGYETDERDRIYIKLRIPKSELYGIWKNKKGEDRTISKIFSGRGSGDKYSSKNYTDTYGGYKGHYG